MSEHSRYYSSHCDTWVRFLGLGVRTLWLGLALGLGLGFRIRVKTRVRIELALGWIPLNQELRAYVYWW